MDELIIKAIIAQREREVKDMTPTISRPRGAAFRAVVAARLAKLALLIDQDAAGNATGGQAVDFLSRRSS